MQPPAPTTADPAETVLTAAGRHRLERLARRSGTTRYDGHTSGHGSDDTGSVELDVDPTGWVTGARVVELSDGLRTPAGFAGAVRTAYARAEADRLLGSVRSQHPEAAPAPQEPPVLRRSFPLSRPVVARPDGPVTPRPATPDSETVGRHAVHAGRSAEGEVTVRIREGNGLVELVVDGEWLARTSTDYVTYALREAFAAALATGEGR